MPSSRRATDYTPLRHLTESLLASISGNGWMAALAHRLGWQAGLRIDRCELSLPALDAALPPLRIAFASDFHAAPTTHPHAIAGACQILRELHPDVLLLGGDFVSLHARHIESVAAALADVPAPLRRYAGRARCRGHVRGCARDADCGDAFARGLSAPRGAPV